MNVPVPHERFVLETPLGPSEVVRRLRNGTAFKGSVDQDEFRLRRAILYGNSFLPVLHGQIEATATGTRLRVSMRLRGGILAFMGMCFGLFTVISVAIVAIAVVEGKFTPLVFAPLPFYAFGYAFVVGGFKLESGRSARRSRPC